ncbi:protein kinase [bacterium]|nr:protein kinase [bacterium]
MTPEQWKQIDELVQTALELESAKRSAFLDRACNGDDLVRSEIDSLLLAHGQAHDFIETPPVDIVAHLLSGEESATDLKSFGSYRILRSLGAGGMGEVYLAEDTRLHRHVALKRLPALLTHDEFSRARLIHEAQLASTLNHPNICTIYHVEESQGEYIIAMEYVEGKTLSNVICDRPLPLKDLLSIALQVADVLAVAHSQGIIHRDIKAGNVIVSDHGKVKVLDFGLAKLLNEQSLKQSRISESHVTGSSSGVRMGTPSYLSPEQAKGESVDHRTDIFSFGVVLYEMATGRLPFQEEAPAQSIRAVIEKTPIPVRELNPKIPTRLLKIIDRALAKRREERYQTMNEFIEDLKKISESVVRFDKKLTLKLSLAAAILIVVAFLTVSQFARLKGPISAPISLSGGEDSYRSGSGSVNPEANLAYFRGLNSTRSPDLVEGWVSATRMFERAVELDPGFAKAYAELAQGYAAMFYFGVDRRETRLAKAEAAIERAFKLHPGLPEAHLARGFYCYWGRKDLDHALKEFTIAQRGLPTNVRLFEGIALVYRRQGNFEAASENFNRILELNPRDPATSFNLAVTYLNMRKYSEADAYCDRTIALAPQQLYAYGSKAQIQLLWKGEIKTARAILEKMPVQENDSAFFQWHQIDLCDRNFQGLLQRLSWLPDDYYEGPGFASTKSQFAGLLYAFMRKRELARTSFETARVIEEEKVQQRPDDPARRASLAVVYAGLGWKQQAIKEAKLAVQLCPSEDAFCRPAFIEKLAHVYTLVGEFDAAMDQIEYLLSVPCLVSAPLLKIDPRWDPLRGHTRFRKVVTR